MDGSLIFLLNQISTRLFREVASRENMQYATCNCAKERDVHHLHVPIVAERISQGDLGLIFGFAEGNPDGEEGQ
jgi:hypothetical protein